NMADIPWGSEEAHKFVTNVGLITSNGPFGHNVMAAEWTHHVSYSPGLIMVNVGYNKATEANILKTKEFGVSIAASDQNVASSVSGGSTGKEVDKIKVLEGLGIEFYRAKRINTLMVKGAAMNAECRLVKAEKLGDHWMFVGEVLAAAAGGKEPLIFGGGSYWEFGGRVQKPPKETIAKINTLVEKYRKK
ncbi:MAG: flavin reductase family protein, partial [Candidatus Aenigmarchaeota archaeon]|nr:flavin reductase family protein [Candidatus Aenigmarchaeota archaeon]